MIWLALLILSSIPSTFVNTIYASTLGAIGNVQNISRQNLLASHKVTSYESCINMTKITIMYGYVIEEHKVTTKDGYILGLHRLTKKNGSNNGVSVFLMHGLLDSSDSWILQGPSTALGYLLVDRGFDVWMGNARGNKHSSTHSSSNPTEQSFWKFSWEEIGLYDLPAMIDYVLKASDKDSLYYIGHSQGTTSFFVMNSMLPEYKRKVKMMFALSPIAWLSHADSPVLKYLTTVSNTVLQYFYMFNTQTSSLDFLNQIYGAVCKVASKECGSIFEMLFGTNYFVSESMLPVILENASSSSVLQFVHYSQLYKSGRFCRFDYGWMRNLIEYGRLSPPDYDLSDITTPIVLFFSGNDRLSHPSDVSILYNRLPNVFKSYYSQYFSHIDYMYASVAKDAIYEKIIRDIQIYEQLQ